jgi:SOS-response transcriptional repressor LexA
VRFILAKLGKDTVAAALERIKKYLGLHTEGEIAEYLGITKQTMSNWKNRGSLDLGVIRDKLPKLSIDWLLIGVGEPTIVTKLVDDISKKVYDDDGILKGFGKLNSIVKEQEEKYTDEKNRLKKMVESPSIPVYYGVSAGDPANTFNEMRGVYKYDYSANKNNIGLFVNTDSYKEHHILNGDTLIVDEHRLPDNGNIVFARYDGQYELFLYHENKDGNHFEYLSNNKPKDKIPYDGLIEVGGVVIAKIKNY